MIQDAMTIAGDAYRDATRRKVVGYLLLLIAILQVAVFSLYDEISLGISVKMMKDAGLGMLLLVAIVSSLCVAFQVPRELRDRTAMTLFAKPMGRESYLIGKVVGVTLLSLRNIAIVGIGILLVYVLKGNVLGEEGFTVGFLQSLVLSLVAAIDLIALGLMLSLFLSEGAVVIGVMIALFVGSSSYAWSVSESGLASIASVLKYILPNFYLLDIKTEVAGGLSSSLSYASTSVAYGLAYAVMLTALSITIFKRRDL